MEHAVITARQIFTSYESHGISIIISAVICFAIGAFFVALRIYTRRVVISVFGWEDVFLLVALLFSALESAGQIYGVTLGLGSHIWAFPYTNMVPLLKAEIFSNIFYILTVTFIKISVLVLYRKIFSQASNIRRYVNHVIMAIVILSAIWLVISNLTTCIPLEAFWNPAVLGVCWSTQIWFFNSALHLITDCLIFMLPMPMLRRLNVPRKQRVFLIGIFSLGFIVCLISLIRLIVLIRIESNPIAMADFTYNLAPISYWNVIEFNLGIVVACLMTMRPLAARILPRWFASTIDRHSDGSGGINSGPTVVPIEWSKESGRGEITTFEADVWLENQIQAKSPSNISTSTQADDLDTRPSKSTLKTGTTITPPASPMAPLATETKLHPPPVSKKQQAKIGSFYLNSPSEKESTSAGSRSSAERHTSGFLESASDEEGTTGEEKDEHHRRAGERVCREGQSLW